MGTWGPEAFDNDDALDLLDALSGQDSVARRRVLERIFGEAREHPENLNFTLGAAEVVAAAAVVAAGLPAGGAVAQEITRHDYDVTALVIPGRDPELAGAALAALLIAAGHDGAWHRDWTDPRTAAQARQTTDQLASVFYHDQHRHDQELPLEPDPAEQPAAADKDRIRSTSVSAESRYELRGVIRIMRRQADRSPITHMRRVGWS